MSKTIDNTTNLMFFNFKNDILIIAKIKNVNLVGTVIELIKAIIIFQ